MSFDFIVHRRDQKTGQVIEVRPYKYVVSREGSYYERDGVRYDAAGTVLSETIKAEAVKSAELVEAAKKTESENGKKWSAK